MENTLEYLQRSIEHAPRNPGKLAANLVGWTIGELQVCNHCAGRIMGRGCMFPREAEPVWMPEIVVCALSEFHTF